MEKNCVLVFRFRQATFDLKGAFFVKGFYLRLK